MGWLRKRQLPFDLVNPAPAKAAIAEILVPFVASFEQVDAGTWACVLPAGHYQVLKIGALKGAQYHLLVGISCPWVPHSVGQQWRWHRSLKQTRLDLWVESTERTMLIDSLHGIDKVRDDARRVLHVTERMAPAWWEAVTTVEGVLAEALRQEAEGNSIHYPRPAFVAAFTLARLGRVSEARQKFESARVLAPKDNARASRSIRRLVRIMTCTHLPRTDLPKSA